MYEEPKMEKLTINLPPVELARIDLLIEAGYYPSRTEFIRMSIRKTLDAYQEVIDKRVKEYREEFDKIVKDEKKYSSHFFGVGVFVIDKDTFTKALKENKKIKITAFGLLSIQKGVTAEMIEKTVDEVKIYGVLRASKEVKNALERIKDKKR